MSGNITQRACVAYTINEQYLFPTLLSAIQARENVDGDTTDVVILCIGDVTKWSHIARGICDSRGIGFKQVHRDQIDNMPIMYARLFLDSLLGGSYHRVIYIDGDTQITGTLRDLVAAPIPAGMILAARDPMTLTIGEDSKLGRQHKAHLESLGLRPQQIGTYFNSGVICFNNSDWAEIRRECLRQHVLHQRSFRFPDQDLLNLATPERHLTMSFKWNFPSYFLFHRGVEAMIQPRIYHFMSNPRPWQGGFKPWGGSFFRPYDEMVARYPALAELRPSLPRRMILKYALQQYYKAIEERLVWRSAQFRRSLILTEEQVVV